jgi:DnaJ-class molecular chaperone
MADVVACQHCHGNGKIEVEVKPGKWQTKNCPACGGSGKVNKKLI